MVAQQKAVKDHKLVILLKKHSEIVKFIIDLRLKWRFDRKNMPIHCCFRSQKSVWLSNQPLNRLIFILLKDFKLFSQYTNDFNGIDGHALFIGTVIHSLDHYLNEKHSEPLMFDVDCEKYGKMNEVLRFVRSSFVEKPPGLLFRHMYKGIRDQQTVRPWCNGMNALKSDDPSFKDGYHPFYGEVYEAAAKINLEFANQMDACIIR